MLLQQTSFNLYTVLSLLGFVVMLLLAFEACKLTSQASFPLSFGLGACLKPGNHPLTQRIKHLLLLGDFQTASASQCWSLFHFICQESLPHHALPQPNFFLDVCFREILSIGTLYDYEILTFLLLLFE